MYCKVSKCCMELNKDNLYEIRKYLDDESFLNSLLVCKSWSDYDYKEKSRRVRNKIAPIVLNHGFRRKIVSFAKYNATYGAPYYGICLYKGKNVHSIVLDHLKMLKRSGSTIEISSTVHMRNCYPLDLHSPKVIILSLFHRNMNII